MLSFLLIPFRNTNNAGVDFSLTEEQKTIFNNKVEKEKQSYIEAQVTALEDLSLANESFKRGMEVVRSEIEYTKEVISIMEKTVVATVEKYTAALKKAQEKCDYADLISLLYHDKYLRESLTPEAYKVIQEARRTSPVPTAPVTTGDTATK